LPQPSDLPALLPSAGQLGAQQLPMYIMLPIGQLHIPPQPSVLPALLPSFGQEGVQQLPP
jgi:hypothetical protein